MTDINDLVQEFWTSSNGAAGTIFFAMLGLRGILRECFDSLDVRFDIIFFFATAVDLADNDLQESANPHNSWCYRDQSPVDDRIILRDKFKILSDGYQKMIDRSFSKSKDLGDMLRFLPGVAVQKNLSMQGMADLYKIELDFLKGLESIQLLRPTYYGSALYPYYGSALYPGYILDDYLSDFLEDRDRSQLYYCDPELQHISICRQILSLSYQSNVFDLQS